MEPLKFPDTLKLCSRNVQTKLLKTVLGLISDTSRNLRSTPPPKINSSFLAFQFLTLSISLKLDPLIHTSGRTPQIPDQIQILPGRQTWQKKRRSGSRSVPVAGRTLSSLEQMLLWKLRISPRVERGLASLHFQGSRSAV